MEKLEQNSGGSAAETMNKTRSKWERHSRGTQAHLNSGF